MVLVREYPTWVAAGAQAISDYVHMTASNLAITMHEADRTASEGHEEQSRCLPRLTPISP